MNKLTKALAASALVAGAVFAVPAVANAAAYPPASTVVASTTASPGGPFSVGFGAGTFAGSTAVTATFTSTGPVPTTATVADFRAATSAVQGHANADGSVTISGAVPANATASITVTLTQNNDPARGASAVIYVATPVAASNVVTTPTTGLATTGTYISLATVWGAVGLVALGGGVIAVRQLGRKREQSNNA